MWKVLLLAVIANSLFLSLGIYVAEDDSNEGRYISRPRYYSDEDSESEEESEEDNENVERGYNYNSIRGSKNYAVGDTDKYSVGDTNNYPERNIYNYREKDRDNYAVKETYNYPVRDTNNYPVKNSDNYPKGDTDSYPEECSNDYTEGDSDYYTRRCSKNYYPGGKLTGSQCTNALHKFNDGVLSSGLQLFKSYVDSSPKETGVISPLATLYLLAALALFSKLRTQAELYELLNQSNRNEIIICSLGRINNVIYNLPKNVEFYVSSNIFADDSHPFTDEFKYVMANIIGGVARNLDFASSLVPDDVIDAQVELGTNNKVKNIIENYRIFNESTELAGISGTYFSSPWEIEFEPSKYVNQFNIAPCECVPGNFYSQVAVYDYAHSSELQAKAVRINYLDNIFNVIVIVPDEPFTEKRIIDRMLESPTGWYKRLNNILKETKVNLTIPAFNQENSADTLSLLFEGTDLETIYSRDTIQLKGMIEGDKQAGVSVGLQKHVIQEPSEGGPVKNLPKGEAVEFVANIPHFFIVFITGTQTPIYFGYTNGPTTGVSL